MATFATHGHVGFIQRELIGYNAKTMRYIVRCHALGVLALLLQLCTSKTRAYGFMKAATPRHRHALQDGKPQHIFSGIEELETGAMVHVDYDVTLADQLVLLAQDSSLRSLRCGPKPEGGLQAKAGNRQYMRPQSQLGAMEETEEQGLPLPGQPRAMLAALEVDNYETALTWPPGAVLVGEEGWGCAPPGSDRSAAFYLRLTTRGRVHSPADPLEPRLAAVFGLISHEREPGQSPQPPGGQRQQQREVAGAMWSDVFGIAKTGAASSIVVFEVEQVGVEHCFREARIAYRYVPRGHIDHPRRHSVAGAASTTNDVSAPTRSSPSTADYNVGASESDRGTQSPPQPLPAHASRGMRPGPRVSTLSAEDLQVAHALLHAISPAETVTAARAAVTGPRDEGTADTTLDLEGGAGLSFRPGSNDAKSKLGPASNLSRCGSEETGARLCGSEAARRSAMELYESMAAAAAKAKAMATVEAAAVAAGGSVEFAAGSAADSAPGDAVASAIDPSAADGAVDATSLTRGTATGFMGVNFNPVNGTARAASLLLVTKASDTTGTATGGGGGGQSLTSVDVSLGCRGCFATLESGIAFELVVMPQQEYPYMRLEYMRVSLFGQLTVSVDVALHAGRAVSLGSETLSLLPLEHVGSLAFLAGPVPVTLSLATALQAHVSLSVGAPGAASTGLSYSEYVELGAEFRRQWQEFRQIPMQAFNGFEVHSTQLTVPGPVALEVAIMPVFSINLWLQNPVTLSPKFLLGLTSQSTPGGATCSGLRYQVYTGMDAAVAVGDGIRIPQPGADMRQQSLLLGQPYLPWSSTVTLLPRAYPTCPACSGCIHDTRATAGSAYWAVGAWGPCSASCGGGNRTRRVECRQRSAAGVETPVLDNLCSAAISGGGGAPKPASAQPCNLKACGLAKACPVSCTAEMLGNDQCDRECMVLECGYDNGYCAAQLAVATACLKATTCADCITLKTSCGWCASANGSGSCMPGSAWGPAAGFTCTAAVASNPADDTVSSGGSISVGRWRTSQCTAAELRLAVIQPATATVLVVGDVASVAWSGGGANVQLYLRIGGAGPLTTGLGLPSDAVPNTGSFKWTVAPGVPPGSDYHVVLHSTTDTTNIATSAAFSIVLRPGPFTWRADKWGPCNATCGGGTRIRNVTCIDISNENNTDIDEANCNPTTKPPRSETCNPWPCQLDCPVRADTFLTCNTSLRGAARPPFPSAPSSYTSPSCSACSCLRRPGALGFMCGMTTAQIGEVLSCYPTGDSTMDYQECCRRNGMVCDDGCTDKAQWVEVGRGVCSQWCGGGTQSRTFSCLGSYNPGCGGMDLQCAQDVTCPAAKCSGLDPGTLLYDCNLQACPVYGWAAGEWGPCDGPCRGGMQSRNITCLPGTHSTATSSRSNSSGGSDAWAPAPDSYCAGLPRPISRRSCNPQPCPNPPLRLLTPGLGAVLRAGDAAAVNITWGGGDPDDIVTVTAALVARSLAARPIEGGSSIVSPLQWLPVGSLGLPSGVPNVGWAAWSVPPEVESGWYVLRLALMGGSSNGTGNKAISDWPVAVQSMISYVAMFLPWSSSPSSSSSSSLSSSSGQLNSRVQLSLRGAYGNTAASGALDLSSAPYQKAARGAKALTLTCLDVGAPLDVGVQLTLTRPASPGVVSANATPAAMPAFSVVLLDSLWHKFEAGFPAGVSAVVSGPVMSPICGAFNGSCAACASLSGCGYCHASGECMALGGAAAGGGPAVRSCPLFAWATTSTACGDDRCAGLHSCASCMRVAGCGWCAETCSCSAVDLLTLGSVSNGSSSNKGAVCRASGWLPFLSPGQTCTSAPQTSGSKCTSEPFQVRARATLAAIPAGGSRGVGVVIANGSTLAVRLSAAGSVPVTDCAAAGCVPAPKGTCTAIGTLSYCGCANGWSGPLCEVPPGPCWGDNNTCPVGSLCLEVVTAATNGTAKVAAACMCQPGYTFGGLGSDCIRDTEALPPAPPSPRAPPLPPPVPKPPAPSCGVNGTGCNGRGTCGAAAPRCSCDDGWGDIHNCVQEEAFDNGWDCSCQCPTDLETCVPGSGGACRWCVSLDFSAGCVPVNQPCPLYTYLGGGRALLAEPPEDLGQSTNHITTAGGAADTASAAMRVANAAEMAGWARRLRAATSVVPSIIRHLRHTGAAALAAADVSSHKPYVSSNGSSVIPGRLLQQETPLVSDASSPVTSSPYTWQLVTAPPAGNNASIINSTQSEALVTGISPGLYEFQLVITDNNGNTNAARAKVTVSVDSLPLALPPLSNAPVGGSPPLATTPASTPAPLLTHPMPLIPEPSRVQPPPPPPPLPMLEAPTPAAPTLVVPDSSRSYSSSPSPPSLPPPRPSPTFSFLEAEVYLAVALPVTTSLPVVRGAMLQLSYNYLLVTVRFQANSSWSNCTQGPQAALAASLATLLRIPAANISTMSCKAGSGTDGVANGGTCGAGAATQATLMFKLDPATNMEDFKAAVFRVFDAVRLGNSTTSTLAELCPPVTGETDASKAATGSMVRAVTIADSGFSECSAFVPVLLSAVQPLTGNASSTTASSVTVTLTQVHCRSTTYTSGPYGQPPLATPPPRLNGGGGAAADMLNGGDEVGHGGKVNGDGSSRASKTVIIAPVAAAGAVVLLVAVVVLLLCCRRRHKRGVKESKAAVGGTAGEEVKAVEEVTEPVVASRGCDPRWQRWSLFACCLGRGPGCCRCTRVAPNDTRLNSEGDLELAAAGVSPSGISSIRSGRREAFKESAAAAAAGGAVEAAAANDKQLSKDAELAVTKDRAVGSDMLLVVTAGVPQSPQSEDLVPKAMVTDEPSGLLPPGRVPSEPEPKVQVLLMPGDRTLNGGAAAGGGVDAAQVGSFGEAGSSSHHEGTLAKVASLFLASGNAVEPGAPRSSSLPEPVGPLTTPAASELSLAMMAELSTMAGPSSSSSTVASRAVGGVSITHVPSSPSSPILPVSRSFPRVSLLPPITGPLEHLPQLDPTLAPRNFGVRLALPVTVPQNQNSSGSPGGVHRSPGGDSADGGAGGDTEGIRGEDNILALLPSAAVRRPVLPSLAISTPLVATAPSGKALAKNPFARPMIPEMRHGSEERDSGGPSAPLPPVAGLGSPSGGASKDSVLGARDAVAAMTSVAHGSGNSLRTSTVGVEEETKRKELLLNVKEEGMERGMDIEEKRKLLGSVSRGSRPFAAADVADAVRAAAAAAAAAAVASASAAATEGGKVRSLLRPGGHEGEADMSDDEHYGAVAAGGNDVLGGAVRQLWHRPGGGEASGSLDEGAAAGKVGGDDTGSVQGGNVRQFRRPDGGEASGGLDDGAPAGVSISSVTDCEGQRGPIRQFYRPADGGPVGDVHTDEASKVSSGGDGREAGLELREQRNFQRPGSSGLSVDAELESYAAPAAAGSPATAKAGCPEVPQASAARGVKYGSTGVDLAAAELEVDSRAPLTADVTSVVASTISGHSPAAARQFKFGGMAADKDYMDADDLNLDSDGSDVWGGAVATGGLGSEEELRLRALRRAARHGTLLSDEAIGPVDLMQLQREKRRRAQLHRMEQNAAWTEGRGEQDQDRAQAGQQQPQEEPTDSVVATEVAVVAPEP